MPRWASEAWKQFIPRKIIRPQNPCGQLVFCKISFKKLFYFHINRQLPMNTVLDVLNDLKIAQFTMKEGKIIVETPQDKKR